MTKQNKQNTKRQTNSEKFQFHIFSIIFSHLFSYLVILTILTILFIFLIFNAISLMNNLHFLCMCSFKVSMFQLNHDLGKKNV